MAEDYNHSRNDFELRQRVIDGQGACEELVTRFHQPLERFLVSLCGRDDGRSRERAVEIGARMMAELPSLLEKWNGGGSLEAFLRASGENRLKSWWRSAEKTRVTVNTDSLAVQHAVRAADGEAVDEAEALLAADALREGVQAASERTPEGVAFLRLKGLHGADQRAIARCWGLDESGISRRIASAMEVIRETAAACAAGNGGDELPFAALQLALQRDPSILLGNGHGPADTGDDSLLAAVSRGDADKPAKLAAARAMCRDHRNLALFAGLLNRDLGRGPAIVRDPELRALEARLFDCLRRTLELLRPADAAGLVTPLMSASFADALALIGAEGGTLWMLSPGEAVLEAVFNPLEPELAGKRQPLVSGIVSLVLATSETVCVEDASTHRRHSPAIDHALGKTTRGMIAVPFHLGGSTRGVLTAVRFTGEAAFGDRETNILGRQAEILTSLMTRAIEEKVLAH